MPLIFLVLLVFSQNVFADKIYTWIDAKGVRHFGSQPPVGALPINPRLGIPEPVVIEPKPKPAPPVSVSAEQQAIDEKVKQQVAEDTAKLQTLCTQLRTSLAQLKNNPRIRIETEGKVEKISEEDRQKYITETEQKLVEHCQD